MSSRDPRGRAERAGRRPAQLAGASLAVLVLGTIGLAGAINGGGVQGLASAAPPPVPLAFHGLGSTFPDGAPARVSGGFGEDTCVACHWEFEDEDDSVGSVGLSGLPESWKPGASYTLDIELERAGMAVGGFQLAARFAEDTTQAGLFHVPEHETDRVALLDEGGLLFAQHTEAGTSGDEETGRILWSVVWEAPETDGSGNGEVVLNVSAVAGDGDRSQMGDYVYSRELRLLRRAAPGGSAER